MKAESPSERILVQDILNFVQQIIIDEQRAGRAIEDEYQAQLGAALNEDIPPLPSAPLSMKTSLRSRSRRSRRSSPVRKSPGACRISWRSAELRTKKRSPVRSI